MKFLLILLWFIIAQYTCAQDKQIGYIMSIRDTSGFTPVITTNFDTIQAITYKYFEIENLKEIVDNNGNIEIDIPGVKIYIERKWLIRKSNGKYKMRIYDNKERLD